MPSPTQFILVDFENVHAIDLSPIGGKPVHVALFIGSKQTKMAMELAAQLHTFAAQVSLVHVGASGRNALDLTLASYLGRSIERHPGARFAIVSKDRDFDAMIAHWRGHGIDLTRADAFPAVPFLNPSSRQTKAVRPRPSPVRRPIASPPAASPAVDRAARVMGRLSNPQNRNRPASRKALCAHLKTALGKDVSDSAVEEAIQALLTRKVLSIDERGKVSYTK